MEEIKLYKLMIKSHYETGINYLCVTKRKDFKSYNGSGLLWKRLLSKHSKSEIITTLLFSSDDLEEFNDYCIYYSLLLDVANNKDFANLIMETGFDPTTGNNLEIWWKTAPDWKIQKAIDKRMFSMRKTYSERNMPLMYHARLGLKKYCEIHGVANAAQIPTVKEKSKKKYKETLVERYGVNHISQIPEINTRITSKRKETLFNTYGVENILQVPEFAKLVAEKRKRTLLERYGVENPSQIPGNSEKMSIKLKNTLANRTPIACKYCSLEFIGLAYHENRCIHNPDRISTGTSSCIHCDIKTTPANIKRWHNDNCKRIKK